MVVGVLERLSETRQLLSAEGKIIMNPSWGSWLRAQAQFLFLVLFPSRSNH